MLKNFPLPSFDENESHILPVIMYHALKEDACEEQLQWLRANKYTSAHLSEVSNYFLNPLSVSFPINKIVLTFDDGYQGFYTSVCPLLKTFNFKATLCIPTGEIPFRENERQNPPEWTEGKGPLMIWDEIKELKNLKTADGEDLIEFIPHSVTHRYFDKLELLDDPKTEFRKEVRESREKLNVELGIDIDSVQFYCLPGGIGEGKEVIERVLYEENYIGALRAQYQKGEGWNQYRIPRCEPNNRDDLIRLLSDVGFNCK